MSISCYHNGDTEPGVARTMGNGTAGHNVSMYTSYDSYQAEHGEAAWLAVLATARAWWSCNFVVNVVVTRV